MPSLRDRVLAEWRGYRETPPASERAASVGSLIAKAMQGLGLGSRVKESEVLQAWKETVGEFISAHSTPSRLRDGVLYVRVLQPSVHFELERVWKPQIVEKLRTRFGPKTVRDVKFRVG